ncbi:MAG TPA: DNA repair protein RecN, partial [Nitrospiraceae bacterium]|nr:DNA repair protein RecN [Nitrospiraceae bacterium]
MLRELHIKNLAIIEDVSIEFDKGLNVLTGETGAGKSIIIDALGLCIGERASSVLIRSGEKEAIVEAFFDIPPLKTLVDMAIEQDEGIIMKRIIPSSGKSRAYINGALVNVQTLSEVSRDIIDIHGQYEHQSLLLPENQLEMIDGYGRLLKEREDFSVVYARLMALRQQMEELKTRERERVQKIDMLKFQIGEIEAAGLKKGEEEATTEELKVLSNTERLLSLANEAYDSLYTSERAIQNSLSKAINAIREIASIDNRATETLRTIEEAMPLIEEASIFLRSYKDSLDFDPSRLEALQERHELIKRLIKKYGTDIQEILDYKEKAQRELNELQSSEEKLEYLKTEIEDLRKILTEKANSLSKKRKAVAGEIEKKVVAELKTLSMPHTRFSIKMFCEQGEDTIDGFKANPKGIDKVEYLISPNPGEELRA